MIEIREFPPELDAVTAWEVCAFLHWVVVGINRVHWLGLASNVELAEAQQAFAFAHQVFIGHAAVHQDLPRC